MRSWQQTSLVNTPVLRNQTQTSKVFINKKDIKNYFELNKNKSSTSDFVGCH